MEFKGTKGKWEADEDHVASLDETVNGNLICVIPEQMYYRSREKWEANALLISRAPEMLEMLNNLVNNRTEILNGLNESKGKYDYEWLFNGAEKLIKEATEI
ncbi:hypothetical protein [Chryseobacterium sp. 2VB]|uniref:hypothetical protein n=1 Tax=Chryseobacterium sp. 2VB TaxID=2502204 RepID=UPI0010F47EE8|nr:hypothetical protein [Chryseobacterium sp. 2VB]